MGVVEIVIIIAAVLIVLGVATVSIVRKVKGKPSINSECCGCPYAKGCDHDCEHAKLKDKKS